MDIVVALGLILSVILGSGIVFALRPKTSTVKFLLSFSGAYLLSVCVMEMIPEVYGALAMRSGVFILVGFLIQLILSYFSDGMEHGHMHTGQHSLSMAVLVSLFVHSFVEGMALGGDVPHTHFGQSLLAGIFLHKIPVAVVITTVLSQGTMKMSRVYLILAIFALTSPAGAWFATHAETLWMQEGFLVPVVLAVVSGMLLHISTIILFETSHDHRFNAYKLITILVGVSLAFAAHFLGA
ncbi:MAG: ZIP family metal transporter [Flavobacteriales bacterium]|nr:ZIP family metal transporter [Flavobacteriales bacterium]MCB9447364.1 ZIP family metal transporter [Flavobacteriales bacterium]